MRAIFAVAKRCYKATQLPVWLPSLIGFGLLTPCVALNTQVQRMARMSLASTHQKAGIA